MADNTLADPAGILSTTELSPAPPALTTNGAPADGPGSAAIDDAQEPTKDLQMTDVPVEQFALTSSSTPIPPSATATANSTAPAGLNNAPSPLPARTSTPMRNLAGEVSTSRAASAHPDPGFTMPTEAVPHGAPVRQYLNSKVTPSLLEGMKLLAKEQPKDPLRVLGEFLIQRAKDLEEGAQFV